MYTTSLMLTVAQRIHVFQSFQPPKPSHVRELQRHFVVDTAAGNVATVTTVATVATVATVTVTVCRRIALIHI